MNEEEREGKEERVFRYILSEDRSFLEVMFRKNINRSFFFQFEYSRRQGRIFRKIGRRFLGKLWKASDWRK